MRERALRDGRKAKGSEMAVTAADSTIELTGVRTSVMRMGMALFLASETFLFGSLFWTYYYLRALTPGWPPHHPSGMLAGINTIFLLAGSVIVWRGTKAIRKGNRKGLSAALLATAMLGVTFLLITLWEWAHEDFRPWTDAYGSIFYTLTGFHALHVFGGVVLMLALHARSARNLFSADNSVAVDIGSLYWHFVDFIWILLFVTVFVVR
jgi:cytochrome c oxidase subunit 3